MTLTDNQVQSFKSDGYLAMPHFYSSREVQAIQAEVGRLKDAGHLRNVATEGDGKTAATQLKNLQLCPMVKQSTLFRALPFDEKVIRCIGQLIGDPFILHLDQVFLKPPKDGMGTNWHQDNAYFQIADPLRGTAMWIAVHDATVENGTLNVIPRRFADLFEHSRDPYSDHHIRCYPPEEESVAVELPAGGVVFFCYGTPHCTRANTSDRERAGVAYHFLHVDYAREELLAPDRDYRPYLTGPQATGGRQEYGAAIAGTWDAEVSDVLSGKATAPERVPALRV